MNEIPTTNFIPTTATFIGIAVAVIFICLSVWFVTKITKDLIAQEKILAILIILLTMISAVWVADKIIAIRIDLLKPEEEKSVFDMIKTMITLVIGYYFGNKKDI